MNSDGPTYNLDLQLDLDKVNQHDKCSGQRPLFKSYCLEKHTHRTSSLPRLLMWSVMMDWMYQQ